MMTFIKELMCLACMEEMASCLSRGRGGSSYQSKVKMNFSSHTLDAMFTAGIKMSTRVSILYFRNPLIANSGKSA